jgi:hypothetical protein
MEQVVPPFRGQASPTLDGVARASVKREGYVAKQLAAIDHMTKTHEQALGEQKTSASAAGRLRLR